MRRIDLQKLSERKIASGLALAKLGHWSNSYYLVGYSIEMALKAIIAKLISSDTIPDKNLINKVYTHDFKVLVGLAGLKRDLDQAIASDNLLGSNWAICSEWTPECRYQEKSSAEAHYLLVATTDSEHGVLPWIKKYW